MNDAQIAITRAEQILNRDKNFINDVPGSFWHYFNGNFGPCHERSREHRVISLCFYAAMMEGK